MSEKKKQAQLRGLLGDLSGPAPRVEPEPAPTQPKQARPGTKAAKPAKEETIQISAYIPKDLHKRVKVELASREQTLTEVLIDLLSKWAK